VHGDDAPRSTPSTAFLPATFQVEGRPLPPCLLALNSQLKVIFNLLLWCPFSSALIGSRCGDPSGLVSGIAVVAHGRIRCKRAGEGARPDRVFFSRSKVLGANLKDLSVFVVSFRVLSIILPPFQNIRCFRFMKQMYIDTFECIYSSELIH
jgi:hypothetical protein